MFYSSRKKLSFKYTFFLIVAVFLLIDGVFLFVLLAERDFDPQNFLGSLTAPFHPNSFPEVGYLTERQLDFKGYSNFFSDLTQRKGALYAYQVLKRAPIAPGIDIHLLGHIVSDEIYKEYGIQGIQFCDHDFRNACSHAIVVGALLEEGEEALSGIREACAKAPGGRGAYTMCFHGLGHGVLAYTGYDLPKALELCKKTGTEQYRNREYIECVGGTIMEITGGGFHNPKLWEEQSMLYMESDDPFSLCANSSMPEIVKPQCFFYLTPHLLKVARAGFAQQTSESFRKAFGFCARIPKDDSVNRDSCFGGFGKEFVVLAQNRDIRRIDEASDNQLSKSYEWCLLAGEKDGTISCIRHAANSLYWGGENRRDAMLRFCNLILDSYYRQSCFTHAIGAVSAYVKDVEYRESFCKELPSRYLQECRSHLGPE